MMKPDFKKFNGLSTRILAGKSEICWREFLLEVYNFTSLCSSKFNEDEIANITKSLHDWKYRCNNLEYKERIGGVFSDITLKAGDICLTDLGLNYKPECAYEHPVLILEKIHDFLVVVPVSSKQEKIENAYDFNTNTGKWYYIKVDGKLGFNSECVLMLDNLKTISKGRIISKKNTINEDINKEDSVFFRVKKLLMQNYFPKQYSLYEKMIQLNNDLVEENERLKKEIELLKHK